MKFYCIQVFCGGIPVSITAVKNDRIFCQTVSKILYDLLVGAMFTLRIHNDGIIIESDNISDKFLGSTMPFVYQNRRLELRVYPEAFIM